MSFTLWLGNLIVCGISKLEPSISDYYYTSMGDVFVGVLFAIALFLYSYKGFDENDDKITNGAAFCAILVALFPTSNNVIQSYPCSIFGINPEVIRYIHFIAAGFFFIILAAYSFFWFTKSGKVITKMKLQRNKVYRICGLLMAISVVLMMLVSFFWSASKGNAIFWLETIGLFAFGISWLVKGETIMTD
jgi:hypothetical protein